MVILGTAKAALVGLAAMGLLADRGKVHLTSPTGPPSIPVGKLQPLGDTVAIQSSGKWKDAGPGVTVRTGDRIRTGENDLAELDLAWARLVLGPSSSLTILPSRLLTTELEQGRLEEHALAHDIIRLRTAEATIRGSGHVIVRRTGEQTSVTAFSGSFRVENALGAVTLGKGRGTVVSTGRAPLEPVDLPPAVRVIEPRGEDPVYVTQDTPALVRWTSSASRHHVQLRVVPTDDIVIGREVTGEEYQSNLPPGLYYWQISAMDASGLESPPVLSGPLCIVDR
jgi:hypothetical protein